MISHCHVLCYVYCRYEFEYGFTVSSFDTHGHMNNVQLACILVDVICSPSAGLGFFVIFLVVQPTAYAHLAHRARYLFGSVCCCLGGRQRSHTSGVNNYNQPHNAPNSDYMYSNMPRDHNSSTYSAMRKTLSNQNLQHHYSEALLPAAAAGALAGAGAGTARSFEQSKLNSSDSRSINSKDSSSSSIYYPHTLSTDDPLLPRHPLDDEDEYGRIINGDILDEEELARAVEDKYSAAAPGGFKASGSFIFFEGNGNGSSGLGRSFSAWNGSAVSNANSNSINSGSSNNARGQRTISSSGLFRAARMNSDESGGGNGGGTF